MCSHSRSLLNPRCRAPSLAFHRCFSFRWRRRTHLAARQQWLLALHERGFLFHRRTGACRAARWRGRATTVGRGGAVGTQGGGRTGRCLASELKVFGGGYRMSSRGGAAASQLLLALLAVLVVLVLVVLVLVLVKGSGTGVASAKAARAGHSRCHRR